jgi:DnaK suppressor protein
MSGRTAVEKDNAPTGSAEGAKPLTEAALRKMPVAQYMNTEQMAFFRDQLRKMQREILDNASNTSAHLREHHAEPDVADQASIEEENALELRTRDRERKLLRKVEEAIARIDDGSYGYCEETGEAIGIPRLLARPTATLTIEAQSRREQKQKLFGR